MSRTHLLGAVSAAAIACFAAGAHAQAPTTITGGGSTLAAADYDVEFATFNAKSPKAMFSNVDPRGGTISYWASGSGTGQLSFLNNDDTCNSSKVISGTATCSGGGGANAVTYGASDATLSSTQISSWSTIAYGKTVSGDLIQLPSMGVGVSVPVVNSSFSKNGGVAFNDNDLCNIFTGGFTNWNQTSVAAKLAAGTITVVYRSDGSGTSFLFLNHLAKVCTGSNAPPSGVTLTATTNYATIFPTTQGGIFQKAVTISNVTYYTPNNFVGESGSGGIANYLSGQGGTTVTSATAYLTPDYTTIDPDSDARLADGTKSKLVVAGAINSDNTTAYTPTLANIISGLNNADSGQYTTAPTGTALSNPSAYVPLIQTTKTGYPIVGYTTFDLAQCYLNKNVAVAIKAFLKDHYGSGAYKSTQTDNGFAALSSTKAAGFVTVIKDNILGNSSGNGLDIEDSKACKGLGR